MSGPDNASPAEAGRLDLHDERVRALLEEYWRSNLRIMAALLALWAAPSFGCGILLADWLNQFNLPGTGLPLGFWFAQQGAIIVFVICILLYCIAMNRLDRRHHDRLEALRAEQSEAQQ